LRDEWDAQIVQALLNGANQHPAELAWFVDDALTFTPQRVLEIGSEAGGSLWLWCQIAADDAQLLAVDNDSQPWLFRGIFGRKRLAGDCRCVRIHLLSRTQTLSGGRSFIGQRCLLDAFDVRSD
jgi:hypothetical protein